MTPSNGIRQEMERAFKKKHSSNTFKFFFYMGAKAILKIASKEVGPVCAKELRLLAKELDEEGR